MKIYRFDAGVGQTIDNFGSMNFLLTGIIHLQAEAQVSCFHLGPNGKVGYHQAVTPQLFLVVRGDGWVRDEKSNRIPVTAGRAVFWDRDEWHESGTDTGLMAIVIESKALDPSQLTPLLLDGS